MKNRKRQNFNLKLYLILPCLLGLLFWAIDDQALVGTKQNDLIALLYVVLYFLIVILTYRNVNKNIEKEYHWLAENAGMMKQGVIKEISLPFAILTKEGHLLWGNDEFLRVIENKKAARRGISNIFPEVTEEILPKDAKDVSIHIKFGDRAYCVELHRVEVDASIEEQPENLKEFLGTDTVINMFLYDETEKQEIEKRKEEENLVIGLLYIDNFEEIFSGLDDVKQVLMMALVERKINKYMQDIDAICKKLEKDKFIFSFKQRYLESLSKNHFSILEEVRSVIVGNDQPVTVSIGIGVGKGTYTERYERARAAIDLALGRGGDQAVVKYSDGEKFFGGKQVQVSRNTRVKARVKAHALKELMEGKENVVVMGHSIGDVDSFGASIGIYQIAKTLGKKAYIVLDEVTSSVKPIRDFFLTQDYEADMIITSEAAENIVSENTLLVIVDVNKGDYTECPALIERSASIVVIDHHRKAGNAITGAVLQYIEPYASSASEMVAEICQYIGHGMKLKPAEAEALYSGIMIDTNYFSNKTGARTFEAMAYLKRSGADAVRIRKMFRESLDEYKMQAEAIQRTELYMDKYAIVDSPSEGLESPTEFAAKIANSLLDINGVKASFVLTKYNKKVYISARSMDEVNVQIMMERYGGGGHINVAGAQLENLTVEEGKQKIRDLIDQMTEEGEL